MAEEEVVAIPVQPSDHKRKLENLESEILEQHVAGSIDSSNEVSVDDDVKNASEYSQAKRTKLDNEATDGLGIDPLSCFKLKMRFFFYLLWLCISKKSSHLFLNLELINETFILIGLCYGIVMLGTGKCLESGEERPDGSKDENQDRDSVIEKVQDPIHAEESEDKMDDNGKPEDNQLASVEAVTCQEVSVEESKEVNISGSQKEADDDSNETNGAIALKEVENKIKEVNNGGSEKEDDSENKEANTGGESKEVNGSGSHEEIGDESKEANGGSSHKDVDDTQSTTRRIDVPSSKVI